MVALIAPRIASAEARYGASNPTLSTEAVIPPTDKSGLMTNFPNMAEGWREQ